MTDGPESRRRASRTASPASSNGRAVNGHRPRAAVPTSLVQPPLNGKLATAKATPRKASKAVPAKVAPSRSAAKAAPTTARKPAPAKANGATANGATPNRASMNGATRPGAGREPDVWDQRVAGVLGFLRRRLTGQYDVDEFGFDPQLTETFIHPVLRLLYQRYFRVEVSGAENLPDGPALLVANHSGTVPMDALMLGMAVHDETPLRRHLRLLGADLVFRIPLLSELARKTGSTLACNPDAERLMRAGEYVGVFPEGFKGIGKLYRDRYKLQRFGRGGFVSAALRTSTPIVPVSIVGAEEIYPIVANVKPVAQATGLPYVPVTPLFPWFGPLGMLPLPSKWLIEFGTPIATDGYADDADDPIVVFNLADQVRETIQQTLLDLLERRPDPFS